MLPIVLRVVGVIVLELDAQASRLRQDLVVLVQVADVLFGGISHIKHVGVVDERELEDLKRKFEAELGR